MGVSCSVPARARQSRGGNWHTRSTIYQAKDPSHSIAVVKLLWCAGDFQRVRSHASRRAAASIKVETREALARIHFGPLHGRSTLDVRLIDMYLEPQLHLMLHDPLSLDPVQCTPTHVAARSRGLAPTRLSCSLTATQTRRPCSVATFHLLKARRERCIWGGWADRASEHPACLDSLWWGSLGCVFHRLCS